MSPLLRWMNEILLPRPCCTTGPLTAAQHPWSYSLKRSCAVNGITRKHSVCQDILNWTRKVHFLLCRTFTTEVWHARHTKKAMRLVLTHRFEVRMKGLEPIRRETLDPKSSAATNYATCAVCDAKIRHFRQISKSGVCRKRSNIWILYIGQRKIFYANHLVSMAIDFTYHRHVSLLSNIQ